MASSYEKSVKGGTKIKLAAPKSKYVEHILGATRTGEAGVAEVFRTMTNRLRDSTWTIVFKGLIITHLMIRDGAPDVTLRFLAESPNKMAISSFSDVQMQGQNIRQYHNYLISRVESYANTKTDWVLEGKGKLKKQTIEKGLLRETESVQHQITALLNIDFFDSEPENEITLTAFRLLIMDLLALYHISNEGAINVLEHYFEMSKPDAERALRIYKKFTKHTDQVVAYLSVARQYEGATRLQIPKLKHAPTGLTRSLEDYLNDPDFEVNRRQYIAQKQAKKDGIKSGATKDPTSDFSKLRLNNGTSTSKPSQPVTQKMEAKGPPPDLIDLFGSIEQNQQTMMQHPQPQFPNAQGMPQYQVQQPQPQFPTTQGVPQYQAQQQPFQGVPGQIPQQLSNGFHSTNPFASMVTQPQQSLTGHPQPQQAFTGQPQQQAPDFFSFGSNQMPSIPQNQVANFQQASLQNGQQQPFMNGAPQPPQFTPQFASSTQMSPMTTGHSTNPFRASMMPQQTASSPSSFSSSSLMSPQSVQQSSNPFRSSSHPSVQNGQSPFNASAPPSSTASFFSTQSPQSIQSFPTMPAAQPLQPARTGTNPFKSAPSSAPTSTFHTPMTSPLAPQKTGTNPFRQTAFVNQQTGQGWQVGQGTIGGLENLETIPVFPRPVNQNQQVQQPWSS